MGEKSVRPARSEQKAGGRRPSRLAVEVSVQNVQGSSGSRRYGGASSKIENTSGHRKILNLTCNQRSTK